MGDKTAKSLAVHRILNTIFKFLDHSGNSLAMRLLMLVADLILPVNPFTEERGPLSKAEEALKKISKRFIKDCPASNPNRIWVFYFIL